MNIIDIFIVAFLIFSVYDGWKRGLIVLAADIIALLLGILLSFKFYLFVSLTAAGILKVPDQAAQVISFFTLAFVFGSLLSLIFGILLKFIPLFIRGSVPDKLSGTMLGGVKGVIYTGIILMVIAALPVAKPIKDAVAQSRLSPPITLRVKVITAYAERYLKSNAKGLVDDTFFLLTVKPGEKSVDLGYTTTKVLVDEKAETEMLRLLNAERQNLGLLPLKMDRRLQDVARAHSRDMFTRGYFAHITPDGKTPADRLNDGKIKYAIMGENLALAPDVQLAHRGLMNSPTHRDNILFPDYRKIGIGAIDGGFYGLMFTQKFTD